MMKQDYPAPGLEIPFALADQWDQMLGEKGHSLTFWEIAQWGADQELEACCAELESIPSPLGVPFGKMAGNALRAARRPKPPSLKDAALDDFNGLVEELGGLQGYSNCVDRIRRALEQLDD